jgi:hypothetical protein
MMVSGDSPQSFKTASEAETVLTVERPFPAAAGRGRSVGAVELSGIRGLPKLTYSGVSKEVNAIHFGPRFSTNTKTL